MHALSVSKWTSKTHNKQQGGNMPLNCSTERSKSNRELEWTEFCTLTGHSSGVRSVAYSPDGRYLASGSWDKTIKVWEVVTGTELRTLAGYSGWVWSVVYSPYGRYLASGSHQTIKIWQVATGKVLRTLTGHSDWVKSVAYSPDGRYLASGSGDKTIKTVQEEKRRLTLPLLTIGS